MTDKKNHPLFVIDQSGAVKWPVVVKIPADGGEFAAFQFTGVFKRLTEDEYDAILNPKKEETKKEETKPDDVVPGKSRAEVLADNAALFPQLMVGWDGPKDAQGQSVPFSIETLKRQIQGVNGQHLSIGLWQAIFEIRSGARLGN
jgi:hypothetical protein